VSDLSPAERLRATETRQSLDSWVQGMPSEELLIVEALLHAVARLVKQLMPPDV
jgi:hypothetical protein